MLGYIIGGIIALFAIGAAMKPKGTSPLNPSSTTGTAEQPDLFKNITMSGPFGFPVTPVVTPPGYKLGGHSVRPSASGDPSGSLPVSSAANQNIPEPAGQILSDGSGAGNYRVCTFEAIGASEADGIAPDGTILFRVTLDPMASPPPISSSDYDALQVLDHINLIGPGGIVPLMNNFNSISPVSAGAGENAVGGYNWLLGSPVTPGATPGNPSGGGF